MNNITYARHEVNVHKDEESNEYYQFTLVIHSKTLEGTDTGTIMGDLQQLIRSYLEGKSIVYRD
jgi:hypothetical protein